MLFLQKKILKENDFSLNIEVENKQRDQDLIIISLIVNLEAKINNKTVYIRDDLLRFIQVSKCERKNT